jgi:ketosteroid isomerase-like protein
MASANAGAVLATYDALNRRDVDGALALVHPEAELDWTESLAPYAEDLRDREGARTFITEFFAMWEHLHWTLGEVLEVDGGHVVAVTRVRARGRDGIEMDTHSAWLWTLRDGLVSRIKLCQTKEDALATLAAERG